MSLCLEHRFPTTERKAQAVWRGTSTDPHGRNDLTRDNWRKNLRVQLVQVGFRGCQGSRALRGFETLWLRVPMQHT